MQTTNKLLVLCFFCLVLTLVSGCGGGVPKLTPAEQAEVDKIFAEHGRDAILYLLLDLRQNMDELNITDEEDKLTLKYVKYFAAQGANVNAKSENNRGLVVTSHSLTPLHVVKYVSTAKFLVSKGADVNAEAKVLGIEGCTPLDIAEGGTVPMPSVIPDVTIPRNTALVEYLESIGAKHGKMGDSLR